MRRNHDQPLTPRTEFAGRQLAFDLPGVLVGCAEYDEGPTGCTVFRFPGGVLTAVDERGGMVGKTDSYDSPSALCFAGGSIYGLEAAAGVTAALSAVVDNPLESFALVNGAIIYDYGRRDNAIYPDMALGAAALGAARPGVFPLGARGAGRSAGVGGVFDFARTEPSGQGGAFRQIGAARLAVFTVVNALGVIMDREGRVALGNRDPVTGERRHPRAELEARIAAGLDTSQPFGNTTLTAVITDVALSPDHLRQFARQVHSSLARAIYPFHTLLDGDVLYAMTTGAVAQSGLSVAALGMIASDLAWDAVLSVAT